MVSFSRHHVHFHGEKRSLIMISKHEVHRKQTNMLDPLLKSLIINFHLRIMRNVANARKMSLALRKHKELFN